MVKLRPSYLLSISEIFISKQLPAYIKQDILNKNIKLHKIYQATINDITYSIDKDTFKKIKALIKDNIKDR